MVKAQMVKNTKNTKKFIKIFKCVSLNKFVYQTCNGLPHPTLELGQSMGPGDKIEQNIKFC